MSSARWKYGLAAKPAKPKSITLRASLLAPALNHQVRRLEIAMDDAGRVSGL